MTTKSIITSVEGRVEQLIADHRRLTEVCQSLKDERDALVLERRDLQQSVKNLEHQLSVLQLCEGLGFLPGAGEQSEARRRARTRVNNLMREVDKCINLLSAAECEQSGEQGV